MKKIDWPKSEIINDERCTPLSALERLVLNSPAARSKGNSALCLDIIAKLEADERSALDGAEHEFLLNACTLPGERVLPPNFNRYFLRVLRALHNAVETTAE